MLTQPVCSANSVCPAASKLTSRIGFHLAGHISFVSQTSFDSRECFNRPQSRISKFDFSLVDHPLCLVPLQDSMSPLTRLTTPLTRLTPSLTRLTPTHPRLNYPMTSRSWLVGTCLHLSKKPIFGNN